MDSPPRARRPSIMEARLRFRGNSQMKHSVAVLALGFILSLGSTARAMPISQADIITLGGTAWTGDQWTLQLTGPITASVTYTVTNADVIGCNICNTTAHWGAAINNDPTMGGFLTATYQIWSGIGPVPPSVITLTANTPGVPFSASVSVLGPCDPFVVCDPLTVSIVTQTRASTVPEPSTLALFGTGLVWFGSMRRRKFRVGQIRTIRAHEVTSARP